MLGLGLPNIAPGARARLGVDVIRYSSIVADFYRLRLAGLTGALCLTARIGSWKERCVSDVAAAAVAVPRSHLEVAQSSVVPFWPSVQAAWQRTLHAWSAQTSRYQLARSQRSLSHPDNDACSFLEIAATRGR